MLTWVKHSSFSEGSSTAFTILLPCKLRFELKKKIRVVSFVALGWNKHFPAWLLQESGTGLKSIGFGIRHIEWTLPTGPFMLVNNTTAVGDFGQVFRFLLASVSSCVNWASQQYIALWPLVRIKWDIACKRPGSWEQPLRSGCPH